jgi:hypothetical protein
MLSTQTASHLLMIRPFSFGYNAETASSNAFQSQSHDLTPDEIREKARDEFDVMVNLLRGKFIHVHVIEDTPTPIKPDAIFPNNWISFHESGSVITYPMEARVRRLERRDDILYALAESFELKNRYYLEFNEKENVYLEGTGSMIFDRVYHCLYACFSSRTNEKLIEQFQGITGYNAFTFTASDKRGKLIYHTNVMMSVGYRFCAICLDSIKNLEERNKVKQSLESTQKEIIELTLDQIDAFAGNMLQVRNDENQTFIVMSEQAYNALRADQIDQLRNHGEIIAAPLYTIEKYGGGSARCMMAEIFLPIRPL